MKCGVALLALLAPLAGAQVIVSKSSPPVVTTSPNPTAQESLAARELLDHRDQMVGSARTESPSTDSCTFMGATVRDLQFLGRRPDDRDANLTSAARTGRMGSA